MADTRTVARPARTLPAVIVDRRWGTRLDLGRCPKCQSRDVHVVSRTEHYLYARCLPCGEIWSLPKPGHGW